MSELLCLHKFILVPLSHDLAAEQRCLHNWLKPSIKEDRTLSDGSQYNDARGQRLQWLTG